MSTRKDSSSSDDGQGTRISPMSTSTPDTSNGSIPVQQVSQSQYLIGTSQQLLPQGVEPLNINFVEQALREAPDIELIKTIRPRGLGLFSVQETQSQTILVARMTEERAKLLMQQGGNQLHIEPDQYLRYTQPPISPPDIAVQDPGVLVPNSLTFNVTIVVKDENDQPVTGAQVYLYGRLLPAQGITNDQGQTQLSLIGETGQTLQGLHIEPETDYWSLWIPSPHLDPAKDNVVTLKSLDQTFPNFPNQQEVGWGQKAMKLDCLPSSYTGKGARVAVIDSGAATTHQDLQGQVKGGYDIVNENDQSWNQDSVHHGSHCTGIVAGKNNNYGIRGFAPEAEVYALKIFPGGQLSALIEALEHCIELQVDVVNLSLGSDQPSSLVELELQKVKAQGIACIVAAGNSGGPVQYPGSSPNVLAVSAIGQRDGTFPPDSNHSRQVFTGGGNPFTPEGYFSAKFSCFGPEVGVCGPGVAILSSVPPNNFTVWDGTSMATPHVTGLAALILAHHPDFQGQGSNTKRDGQRVDRLFQILKQCAQPLVELDPSRVGAGLPDALVAFSLSPSATTPGPSSSDVWQQISELLQSFLSQAGKSTQAVTPMSSNGATPRLLENKDVDRALQELRTLIAQTDLR